MQRTGVPEGRPIARAPGAVPHELDSFLALDGPQSLLIRGPPGTGKTSLAVALLERFYGRRLFLTSRVDPLQLRRQFPWLATDRDREPGLRVSVIDSFGLEGSVTRSARVVARAQEILAEPSLAAGDPALEYLWLPPAVQEALAQVDERHPTLIVLDSWDALIEQFLGGPVPRDAPTPSRETVERYLLRRLHAAGAHGLLVVERGEPSHLDYLVDGVVSTTSQFVDERLERWLTLHKLRRVRIEEAMHPFTLEGGRFAAIPAFPDRWSSDPGPSAPDPAPSPGTVWPGSSAFATEFGRLPVGQASVIEMDNRLPADCERRLVMPMLLHGLAQGGRVLFTPPPTFRAEEIYDLAAGVFPARVLRERLRIFSLTMRAVQRPEVSELLYRWAPERLKFDGDVPLDPLAEEFLAVPPPEGAANLFIDSMASLRALALARGSELSPLTLPGIIQHFLTLAPCAGVIVGPSGDPALESLLGLAGLHVRVRERHGRAVAYGVRPRTSAFVLSAGDISNDPGSAYALRRIV